MAVFITGDLHRDIDIGKLASTRFLEGKNLTHDDYLIICGDCGLVWDDSETDMYWRKWLNDKPWTTLFIDGNHENFDLLEKYPPVSFLGGHTGHIMPHIWHLRRGQVYTICGKTFFTFGGAASHDKHLRKEGVSWWPQEMPSIDEFNRGLDNLLAFDIKVDYIITHDCPKQIKKEVFGFSDTNSLESYLQVILTDIDFKHWYFGHYHVDIDINDNMTCLYDEIRRII